MPSDDEAENAEVAAAQPSLQNTPTIAPNEKAIQAMGYGHQPPNPIPSAPHLNPITSTYDPTVFYQDWESTAAAYAYPSIPPPNYYGYPSMPQSNYYGYSSIMPQWNNFGYPSMPPTQNPMASAQQEIPIPLTTMSFPTDEPNPYGAACASLPKPVPKRRDLLCKKYGKGRSKIHNPDTNKPTSHIEPPLDWPEEEMTAWYQTYTYEEQRYHRDMYKAKLHQDRRSARLLRNKQRYESKGREEYRQNRRTTILNRVRNGPQKKSPKEKRLLVQDLTASRRKDKYNFTTMILAQNAETVKATGRNLRPRNRNSEPERLFPDGTFILKYIETEPYTGEIVGYRKRYRKPFYKIRYSDGEEEEMNEKEVMKHWRLLNDVTDDDIEGDDEEPEFYLGEVEIGLDGENASKKSKGDPNPNKPQGPVMFMGTKETGLGSGYNYTLTTIMNMREAGYTARRLTDQLRICASLLILKWLGMMPLIFSLSLDDTHGKDVSKEEKLWVNPVRQIYANWNKTDEVIAQTERRLKATQSRYNHCCLFFQICLDWYWYQKGYFQNGNENSQQSFFKTLLALHRFLMPNVGCIYLPFDLDLLHGIAMHEAEFRKKYIISYIEEKDEDEMKENLLYKATVEHDTFLKTWLGVNSDHLTLYCTVQPKQFSNDTKGAQVEDFLRKQGITTETVGGYRFIKLRARP